MPAKSIKTIIKGARKNLCSEGYRERSKEYIYVAWREFQEFCDSKGYVRYHSSLKDEFIAELQNKIPPLKPGTIARKISSIKMLDLFAQSGSWVKGELNPLSPMQGEFAEFIEAQDAWLLKCGRSDSTRATTRKSTAAMIRFFQNMGVTKFSELDDTHISAYVLRLKGLAKSTLRCELSRLRKFCEYLFLLGFSNVDLAVHVPQYNLGQSNSWLKIWESNEIEKVLDTVDRSSPKGKRDAAYIVLASELGMRSGDIRNLRLTDIDWVACTISFVQHKTGHPNTLPLNEKVGSTIIDYLHVRPQTNCEYLFVQLIPPYDQMHSFNTAFQKYVHRSGVTVKRDAHHGLHSLRATIATKLLAANVSPDTIFPFLGHSDRETLGSYIRYDIENLRECALAFEGGELI